MVSSMVPVATFSVIRLRDALGVSQAELARLAGISRHTVMRAENGRTVPSPLVQAALARVAQDYLNRTRPAVKGGRPKGRRRKQKSVRPGSDHFEEKVNAKRNVR